MAFSITPIAQGQKPYITQFNNILSEIETGVNDTRDMIYLRKKELSSLDLKSSSTVDLYAAITESRIRPVMIEFKVMAADTITSNATVSVGLNNPDYNDVIDDLELPGLSSTGQSWMFMIEGKIEDPIASDDLKIKVVTAASATTFTVKVSLYYTFEA